MVTGEHMLLLGRLVREHMLLLGGLVMPGGAAVSPESERLATSQVRALTRHALAFGRRSPAQRSVLLVQMRARTCSACLPLS